MEENIRFKFTCKDGSEFELNVAGVANIFEAADELRASITNGDYADQGVTLWNVVSIVDVEG